MRLTLRQLTVDLQNYLILILRAAAEVGGWSTTEGVMSFLSVEDFSTTRSELGSVLIDEAARFLMSRGVLTFNRDALVQMQVSPQIVAGELMMFGADMWPESAKDCVNCGDCPSEIRCPTVASVPSLGKAVRLAAAACVAVLTLLSSPEQMLLHWNTTVEQAVSSTSPRQTVDAKISWKAANAREEAMASKILDRWGDDAYIAFFDDLIVP